ncbi:uncharacterized protein TNCV_131061 [Trichonephila clavipes]|nr:uncharacterized protein TNCV_131061 [Trichonephila clavipes]
MNLYLFAAECASSRDIISTIEPISMEPWTDVSVANPVLTGRADHNIYSPFQSACDKKFISTAGIAVIDFCATERSGIGGERGDIEDLIMGHEDELKTELQEILNKELQETLRNVSPSEQEEDERGPMPTSAIKDLLKKWADVRAMVLKWHPNQADVSRVGDLYNNNAINYFWKILKKREKQSTLDMFFNAP